MKYTNQAIATKRDRRVKEPITLKLVMEAQNSNCNLYPPKESHASLKTQKVRIMTVFSLVLIGAVMDVKNQLGQANCYICVVVAGIEGIDFIITKILKSLSE